MARSKLVKQPVKSRWDTVRVPFSGRLIAHTRKDGLLFCSSETLRGLRSGERPPAELSLARKDVSAIHYKDASVGSDTIELEEDISALELPRWLAEDRGLEYQETE